MKCSLGSLIFLKWSSLPFYCFPLSLHWSLRKAFLSLLAILWNSAFRCLYLSFPPLLFSSLLSQLFVRLPQTAILPFCISFSWGLSWSLSPIQCQEPPSIVHQALYQIWSLKSISHFHCIIIRLKSWSLYCQIQTYAFINSLNTFLSQISYHLSSYLQIIYWNLQSSNEP